MQLRKLQAIVVSTIAMACSTNLSAQSIAINEFLAANQTTNVDQDGESSDWIELFNFGAENINLKDFTLTDDPAGNGLWRFPDTTMQSGEFLLVWASGKDTVASELHTNFRLSKSGEQIGLYDADGLELDLVTFDIQYDDIAMVRFPDGSGDFQRTSVPTPGAANQIEPPDLNIPDIVINEFLASNNATNQDEDGDSSDWIELHNRDSVAIDLAGFTLTDEKDEPALWRLPAVRLPPSDYLLVWASGKNRTDGELHANFKLSAAGEYVGLYTPAGQIVDAFDFGVQVEDVAMARIPDGDGPFESTATPTPNAANMRKIPASDALAFSPASGFFNSAIEVNLSSSLDQVTIRYSTDGSSVTTESERYDEPVALSSTTILRARAFVDSTPVSDDLSQIYVIGYKGHLPVLSLATDENNLYGGQGIFSNHEKEGREWERPVSVNLLELDGSGFQANAGVRVHGSHSRSYPKKSMRLYFRSDYGPPELRYKLFSQKDLDEFDQLVVHAGGSFDQSFGSEEWTLLRDPLNHTLLGELGGAVSSHRPVILYLNGKLWGLYMLRERINDDYLAGNYEVQDADLLEWAFRETPWVKAGDLQAWRDLHGFFNDHDIDSDERFQEVADMIDLDNFIDYHILQIYTGHKDWPHNNSFFFRERRPGAKWRWILWDAESTYRKHRINSLVWSTRDTVRTDISERDSEAQLFATIFMRKLVESEAFNRRFASRFADLLNTTLSPEHIRDTFDRLAAEIEPDLALEVERWDAALSHWQDGVKQVRDFIRRRDHIQWQQLKSFFRLGEIFELSVDTEDHTTGQIRVNTLVPKNLPWIGKYLNRLPVEVEAIPLPGFEFSHWSGASSSTQPIIEIDLEQDETLMAHFDEIQLPTIDFFSTDSGFVGDAFQVFGANLDDVTQVLLAQTPCEFTVVSGEEILAVVPDGATSGKIKVMTPAGAVESEKEFVVLQPEQPVVLASFAPRSAKPGATVTLSGERLTKVQRVEFNGVPALILPDSTDNEIQAKVPFDIQSGPIVIVTATDSVVSDSIFAVIPDTSSGRWFVAEDSYTNKFRPDAILGSASELLATSLQDSGMVTFLKFDLSMLEGVAVKAAHIELCLLQDSEHGGAVYSIDPNWDENTLSWSNAPQPGDNDSVGTFPGAKTGDMIQVDVTAAAGPEGIAFAIVSLSADTLRLGSKEGHYPAQLFVEVDTLVTHAPDHNNDNLPVAIGLSHAYPNPFNATTTIEYGLPRAIHVKLVVYNLLGQAVRTLVNTQQNAGFKRVRWDGKDDHLRDVSSGVYFIRLIADGRTFVHKVLLQK